MMNIFKAFKKEQKSTTPDKINRHNIEITKQDPWTDKKELTQDEMLSQYKSWAYICARLNAESVSSQTLRLYATTSIGQKSIRNYTTKKINNIDAKKIIKNKHFAKPVQSIEEIYDHPALSLVYKVNPWSSYADMFQLTQIYLDLTGNSFWYIVFGDNGMPSQLLPMRPDITHIVPSKTHVIKGYIYGDGKQKTALKKDEVIRFYVPNPKSPYYGKSCIEAGSAEVSRNNLYNTYENSILLNNGRPDFAVKYDGNLTAEDQKRLTMEWNRLYKGPNNAGKVKVMDQNWTIDKLNFAPQEMQYLQGRLYTKKDIASLFGVPYGMMDTSDELKAGLDNILSYYQRFAILPRLRRIEDTLNEQLIPFYDQSGSLFFKFDDPVDDNVRLNMQTNVAYVNAGILSRNEARSTIGYDPVEGGDILQKKEENI